MVQAADHTLHIQALTAMQHCHAFPSPSIALSKPRGVLLDKQDLLKRLEDDRALLEELITLFLATYPSMLTALQEALRRQDPAQVELLMVSLQGMLGNLGATAGVVARLHPAQLVRKQRVEDTTAAYTAVKDLLSHFAEALGSLRLSKRA